MHEKELLHRHEEYLGVLASADQHDRMQQVSFITS